MTFDGFKSSKEKLTPIPETFFSQVLTEVNDLGELKIILYAFWFIHQHQREMQYFTLADLKADEILVSNFKPEPELLLQKTLDQAVQHKVIIYTKHNNISCYFLNTPHGRAACKAMDRGKLISSESSRPAIVLQKERPNLFHLYEENIGPLTPLISDTLQEAEETYPLEWIEEAIRIAVQRNVRNWRYIDAILSSWQKEGRVEKDRRNPQENRRKYIEGDFSDIIEH